MPGEGCSLSDVGKGGKIVRCCLVYKIVQPVRKQQAGMAAPTVKDFLFWVIVLKIMPWNFNGKIFVYISKIFAGQGFPVVFRMTGNEKLAARFAGDQIGARLPPTMPEASAAGRKECPRCGLLYGGNGGQRKVRQNRAPEDALAPAFDVQTRRTSLRQRIFGNPIMMIERRLAPQQM